MSIGQDDVLREALKDGRLDAIISPLVANDPGVQAYPVLQDEAVVVACADHPLFTAPLALATLSDYAWILPGPSVTARRWIDNVFVSRQLAPPKVQIETNSISLLPRLIARTRLLSFLAREALTLSPGMSQLREVPLAETTMRRTVAVSVRAQGYLPPATVALVDILRERGGDFWREA